MKAEIARKGFVYLPKRGEGSPERWRHPLRKTLTISGNNGDDVPLYLEKQVGRLLHPGLNQVTIAITFYGNIPKV